MMPQYFFIFTPLNIFNLFGKTSFMVRSLVGIVGNMPAHVSPIPAMSAENHPASNVAMA